MPINLRPSGFRDTANEYQFGGDCRRFDCCRLLNLHITVKSLLDLGRSAMSFHDSSVPGLVAADMELQCSTVERHNTPLVQDHQSVSSAKPSEDKASKGNQN